MTTTKTGAVFEIYCDAVVYRSGQETECGHLICRKASISEAVRVAGETAICDPETGKWTCSGCRNKNWWKNATDPHAYLAEKGFGR